MANALVAAVRAILREEKVAAYQGTVYNNLYRKCRTLKCYVVEGKVADERILNAAERIEKLMIENGLELEMKVIDSFNRGLRSVIVRLPIGEVGKTPKVVYGQSFPPVLLFDPNEA